jgi:hypothetical protein
MQAGRPGGEKRPGWEVGRSEVELGAKKAVRYLISIIALEWQVSTGRQSRQIAREAAKHRQRAKGGETLISPLSGGCDSPFWNPRAGSPGNRDMSTKPFRASTYATIHDVDLIQKRSKRPVFDSQENDGVIRCFSVARRDMHPFAGAYRREDDPSPDPCVQPRPDWKRACVQTARNPSVYTLVHFCQGTFGLLSAAYWPHGKSAHRDSSSVRSGWGARARWRPIRRRSGARERGEKVTWIAPASRSNSSWGSRP